MKPSEVLRAARKLIERPEQWWKDSGGDPIPKDKHCAMLAIQRSMPKTTTARMRILFDESRDYVRRGAGLDSEVMVSIWNDHSRRTHPEVLAAFDRAIALAEAEESPASELERGRE